ncbi:MAG: thioredoxin [Gemmatimonadota bacterium]|nr:MAG: thioredoxin [Gemmatimonadota bacterium]
MKASGGEAAGRVTVSCQFCLTLNKVDVDRLSHSPKCGSCGKPILLDRPVRVTDDDFHNVIDGADIPVVVDFYADWCAPCKIMAPVLDDFAHEHIGEVLVAKVDTDRNPRTAQKFGIRGIPTLIVFKLGKESNRRIGAVPREELEKLLVSS